MGVFKELQNKENLNSVNYEEYYKENKDIIDRYTKKGYDLDMGQITKKSLELGFDRFKEIGTSGIYNLTKGSLERFNSPEFRTRRNLEPVTETDLKEMDKYLQEIKNDFIKYQGERKAVEKELDDLIKYDPNFAKRFGASTYSFLTSNISNPIDLALLKLTGGISGAGQGAIAKLGVNSTLAKVGINALAFGTEEAIQETMYQYMYEDSIDMGEVAQSALMGTAVFGLGIPLLKGGASTLKLKFLDTLKENKGSLDSLNNKEFVKQGKEIMKSSIETGKDFTEVKNVLGDSVKINDIDYNTLQKVHLTNVVEHLIKDPNFKDIKGIQDIKIDDTFYNSIKTIKNLDSKTNYLTDGTRESINIIDDILNKNKITDISVDIENFNKSIDYIKNSSSLGEGATPIKKRTVETFDNDFIDIVHNNKINKGTVVQEIIQDLGLEKYKKSIGGIDVISDFKVEKIPVIEKIGDNGDILKFKNKNINTGQQAFFKYKNISNGVEYLHKLTKKNGKWENIEILKKKIDDSELGKILTPQEKFIKRTLENQFNLNKKINNIAELREVLTNVLNEFGGVVRKRNNINTIEEAFSFYTNKYKIDDLEIRFSDLKSGRQAQAIKALDKNIIEFSKALENNPNKINELVGLFRHELQHIIDFKKNPSFKGQDLDFKNYSGESVGEFIKKANKGHFTQFKWFEFEYILKNKIDDLKNSKVDVLEQIKKLGYDLPQDLKPYDKENIQNIIDSVITENRNSFEVLEDITTQLDKYLNLKKHIDDIYIGEGTQARKAELTKKYIDENIVLPFSIETNRIKNDLLSEFSISDNGNILNPQKFIDKYESNQGDLLKVIFDNGEVDSNTQYIKKAFDERIDFISKNKNISKESIKLNSLFDISAIIENLTGTDFKHYLGNTKDLNFEYLENGKLFSDPLKPDRKISNKVLELRELFSSKYSDKFNDIKQALLSSVENEQGELKISALFEKATEYINKSELLEIYDTYNLGRYKNIDDIIDYKLVGEKTLKPLEESKKYLAEEFFTESIKKKANINFDNFESMGFINKENIKNIAFDNIPSTRKKINDTVNYLSNETAKLKTLPNGDIKTFENMLGQLGEEYPNSKKVNNDILKHLKYKIGGELGIIDNVFESKAEKAVGDYLAINAKIVLSGVKGLYDLMYETATMGRSARIRYNQSMLEVVKNNAKAFGILLFQGEKLKGINENIYLKYKNNLQNDYFKIIGEGKTDYTGYSSEKLGKYGSNKDKLFNLFNKLAEVTNLYEFTNRGLKLSSYLTAESTLNKVLDNNYTDIVNGKDYHLKSLLKSYDISDIDFENMKYIKDTESFKKYGIFNKIDFENNIPINDVDTNGFDKRLYVKALGDKVDKFYNTIIKDMSPTELQGETSKIKSEIGDPLHRIKFTVDNYFKNSIKNLWDRAYYDYYKSNLNQTSQKFDWGNSLYWQRVSASLAEKIGYLIALDNLTDSDFYEDPIQTIQDKIDNMIDDPTSAGMNMFLKVVDTEIPLYLFKEPYNAFRRPMKVVDSAFKGDTERLQTELIKTMINTQNYNHGKEVIDFITE